MGYVDGGSVYENTNTAATNLARRFEVDNLMLRDAVVKVATNGQSFGDLANQRYDVGVGGELYFTMIDISTLYFRNTAAGQNGTVAIIGIRD